MGQGALIPFFSIFSISKGSLQQSISKQVIRNQIFSYAGRRISFQSTLCLACVFTVLFPETQGKTRVSEQGLKTQLCWAAPVTRTASGYLFIYFWGAASRHLSPQSCPCSLLHGARLLHALLLPALVTGPAAPASSRLEHTLENTVQSFCLPRSRPLLPLL